jgi:hypothetical protein
MKDTKVPTLHTHCPTCRHCTHLHTHVADLVMCLGCRVEGTVCIVTQDPASLQILLRQIFAEASHEAHSQYGV